MRLVRRRRGSTYLTWLMIFCMVFTSMFPAMGVSAAAAESSTGETLPEWAKFEIEELRRLGIIHGYPDGSFQPGKTISRAEWTVMLNRLASQVVDLQSSLAVPSFSDVRDQWFAEEVKHAAAYGLIEGYPDGTFRADELVTRNQSAVMLSRMLNKSPLGNNPFADAEDIPAWAVSSATVLAEWNIMLGDADGAFDGGRELTRAEAAVLLYRMRTALQEEGRLTHTVLASFIDKAGSGITDARVFVHEKGKRSYVRTGKTGPDGQFAVDLLPGEYEIRAVKEEQLAHQSFVIADQPKELLLEAGSAAILTGRIVRENGESAAGALVALTNNPTWYAVTGAEGEFTAYVLPERDYQLAILEDDRTQRLEEDELYSEEDTGILSNLDASEEELEDCDCGLYEDSRTFTAPAAGSTSDMGTIRIGGAPASQTTGGSSTPRPDTEEPDTEEPDTEEPDTEEPDTEEPDTEEPDTEEPDTEEPDTEEPDTEEPDTEEPDTTAPAAPSGLAAKAGDRSVALLWTANTEIDLAGYKVHVSSDNGGTWQPGIDVGNVTSRTITGLDNGNTYTFAVTAYDTSDNESVKSAAVMATPTASIVDDELPPDPVAVAPSLPLAGAVSFAESTSFLYSGSNPIQSDVAEGSIKQEFASVIRGKVLDTAGLPLSGVTITVLDHPEWGRTKSRLDGMFDMAVNGGGTLTFQYEKEGYMTVQRKVHVVWNEYRNLPDVILTAYDLAVTTLDTAGAEEYQVAQGSVVTDEAGTRQATVILQPGTEASMVLPDGTVQPLPSIQFRATEYTVGENGIQAMPGELPTFVGYTYAVELSADEAIAAGAREVRFSKPLYNYVDNFIGFPVGEAVPSGYYDRELGLWVPSDNGIVIKIVHVEDGVAQVDTDGDEAADDEETLLALNLTLEERMKLAELYEAGKTLWRVPVEHFTPYDYNWPLAQPGDAIFPPNSRPNGNRPDVNDPCNQQGSIIGCQDQSLGQTIPITGTNFNLTYTSKRTSGYKDSSTLEIPITNDNVPESMREAQVIIEIAGRTITRVFDPAEHITYSFTWDGMDAYGRKLTGTHPYRVTIRYMYPTVFAEPDTTSFRSTASFGVPGTRSSSDSRPVRINLLRPLTTGWVGELQSPVNPYDDMGISGWSLDAHHTIDIGSNLRVVKGDGTTINPEMSAAEFSVNGREDDPDSIYIGSSDVTPTDAIGPEGELYLEVWEGDSCYMARYNPDGTVQPVDSPESRKLNPDGSVISGASNGRACGLDAAVSSNGDLYVRDWETYSILKKSPNESDWIRVAGGGDEGPESSSYPPTFNGKKAFDVKLVYVMDMEIAPDGSLYFVYRHAESMYSPSYDILYKVEPDGYLRAVSGYGFGSESGMATAASVGSIKSSVEIGPDGSIYVADYYYGDKETRIRKVGPEGEITHIAGSMFGPPPASGASAVEAGITATSFEVDAQGNVYFTQYKEDGNKSLYRVTQEGILEEVAPIIIGYYRNAKPFFDYYYGLLGFALDGSLILNWYDDEGFKYMRIQQDSKLEIVDEYGTLIHSFNEQGLHLTTKDALTDTLVYQYGYDGEGRLTSVADRHGNTVTIERNSEGTPTAIISDGGQRTELDVDEFGQLRAVSNPAGETYQMEYDQNGLLTSFTDPIEQTSRYTYDEDGRLVQVLDPAGGSQQLQKEATDEEYIVTHTDPLNRVTRYEVYRDGTDLKRINIYPGGVRSESTLRNDGSEETVMPDGTIVTSRLGYDPRWGMASPYTAELIVRTPAGRTMTYTESRSVELEEGQMKTYQVVTAMNGAATTTIYDVDTRTYTETTPEGLVTVTYLDELGRVVKVETPGQGIAPREYDYDGQGRLVKVTQGSQYLEYTYDSFHRLISVTDDAGNIKHYDYDSANRLTSVDSAGDKVYGMQYDGIHQQNLVTAADGTAYRLQYNEHGQLSGFGPEGETPWMTMHYDEGGRILQSVLSGERIVNYGYEPDGAKRLISMNDDAINRTFTYVEGTDQARSMSAVTNDGRAASQTIAYTYDGQDMTSAVWSGKANARFDYSYNDFFQLVRIDETVHSDVYSTPLAWDLDGNLTMYGPFTFGRTGPEKRVGSIHDGSMIMTPQYDEIGRVRAMIYSLHGTEMYRIEYTYNDRGFVTQRKLVKPDSEETITYVYDDDGQLLSALHSGPDGELLETYEYDVNKNITSRQVTGSTRQISVYGDFDRLQSVGDVLYSFDEDGFLTARGEDQFVYGAKGELVEAVVDGVTYSYTYDAIGRRTARDDGIGTEQYLYGNPGDLNMLTSSIDENGILTRYYYDEGGLLIGFEREGQRYYVITDGVGTPLEVLDAAGTSVKSLKYDSYGVRMSDSNPEFKLLIGFAGGLADDGTGLIRFGARDYDPAAGRWTAIDPALFDSGQANLYAYVNNNPVSLRDPCGMFCIGASGYYGLGAGGKVCLTGEGFSSCVEVGVGIGGGFELNPSEDLSPSGPELEIAVKGAVGPIGLTLGGKLNDRWGGGCLDPSVVAKLSVGPATWDAMDSSQSSIDISAKGIPEVFLHTAIKSAKVQLEAAAKAKACMQYKW